MPRNKQSSTTYNTELCKLYSNTFKLKHLIFSQRYKRHNSWLVGYHVWQRHVALSKQSQIFNKSNVKDHFCLYCNVNTLQDVEHLKTKRNTKLAFSCSTSSIMFISHQVLYCLSIYRKHQGSHNHETYCFS